jgi:hypothetical protein
MAPMAPPLDTPLPLGLVALAGTMEKRDGGWMVVTVLTLRWVVAVGAG